jgi:hypothetical protein
MKITNAEYLNGQPALDSIHIQITDGATLTLSFEQYKELSDAISQKNIDLLKRMITVNERFEKKRKMYLDLVEDTRKLFYNTVGDDYFTRKEPKDITDEELSDMLEKHQTFLGLE